MPVRRYLPTRDKKVLYYIFRGLGGMTPEAAKEMVETMDAEITPFDLVVDSNEVEKIDNIVSKLMASILAHYRSEPHAAKVLAQPVQRITSYVLLDAMEDVYRPTHKKLMFAKAMAQCARMADFYNILNWSKLRKGFNGPHYFEIDLPKLYKHFKVPLPGSNEPDITRGQMIPDEVDAAPVEVSSIVIGDDAPPTMADPTEKDDTTLDKEELLFRQHRLQELLTQWTESKPAHLADHIGKLRKQYKEIKQQLLDLG